MRKLYFYRFMCLIAAKRLSREVGKIDVENFAVYSRAGTIQNHRILAWEGAFRCVLAAGLLMIVACATPAPFYEKKTSTSYASTDSMHGVRIYEGSLPEHIAYKNLGRVEGCSTDAGLLAENLRFAREEMTRQARLLGANAIIEARPQAGFGDVCLDATAVKASELPEKFSPPDLTTVTSFINSAIVPIDAAGAFSAAKALLEADLYEIASADAKTGVIVTKEEEASTGRLKWRAKNLGGPYPLLTIKIIVEKKDKETTKVTRVDTLRGATWTKEYAKTNADNFFFDMLQYLP